MRPTHTTRERTGFAGAVLLTRSVAALAMLLVVLPVGAPGAGSQTTSAPSGNPVVCAPGAGVVTMTGAATPDLAKTYRVYPFEVAEGTTRVEVGYSWTPGDGTTLDLGLWDADGYRTPDGFRGWGGSREGRLDKGPDAPGGARAWVQADSAERAFIPGTVEAGTWNVELGFAEVAAAGATWTVELKCTDDPVGAQREPDPVDATHVANPSPGWYRGDFHMHGYHSNPEAPDNAGFVRYARDADLDFLPVTEYVVNRHWNEWGEMQRANPDLLIWPGREVITYFGHAIVLGETPSTVEYRQGFEDVTLGAIQDDVLADGAVFGIAHPTTFPEKDFGSTCRGCEFQLSDSIDLDRVDTVEVVTDAVAYGTTQNPFVPTAIDFWTNLLREGHRVTAVSGSDDKLGPDLGSVATMVYADELSLPALQRAVRSGHAYVQTRGAEGSPSLEMTATTPDGPPAIMGDTVVGDTSTITVTVSGGEGQRLRVLRNGTESAVVDVTTSPFVHTFTADRADDEGPLGTFWGVQTFDDVSLTTISNPVFLADEAPTIVTAPTTTMPRPTTTLAPSDADGPTGSSWRGPWTAVGAMTVVVLLLVLARRRVRGR